MREVATRGDEGWKERSKGVSSWRASIAGGGRRTAGGGEAAGGRRAEEV